MFKRKNVCEENKIMSARKDTTFEFSAKDLEDLAKAARPQKRSQICKLDQDQDIIHFYDEKEHKLKHDKLDKLACQHVTKRKRSLETREPFAVYHIELEKFLPFDLVSFIQKLTLETNKNGSIKN
jgi:hypothetical protein